MLLLLIRALIPSWAPPLLPHQKPNYIPKSPSPNSITLGARAPTYEEGSPQFSPWPPPTKTADWLCLQGAYGQICTWNHINGNSFSPGMIPVQKTFLPPSKFPFSLLARTIEKEWTVSESQELKANGRVNCCSQLWNCLV